MRKAVYTGLAGFILALAASAGIAYVYSDTDRRLAAVIGMQNE